MYWENIGEKTSLLEQQFRASKHLQMVAFFFFFFLLFYFSLFTLRVYLAVFKKNHTLRYVDIIQLVSRYSTFQTALITNFFIGYACFDLLAMLKYKEIFEWQFALHHIVSVAAFYASSMYGVFAFIALFRLTSEGSTVFINIRWALLLFKMKETRAYTWTSALIFASFTLFRIVPIAPLWLSFVRLLDEPHWPDVHVGFKILCLGSSIPLDLLNLFWYFKIARIALNMLNTNKTSPSSATNTKTNTTIYSNGIKKKDF